jgi:iron complex transport system substrate-binding protein
MYSTQFQSVDQRSRRQILGYLACGAAVPSALCPYTGHTTMAKRVVSVGGALTEIVFRLQADGDLVGVDSTSIYPTNATSLPSVGYARQLSSEGVLSLMPSHVLATEEAGPPAVLRQIASAGVRVTTLPAKHHYAGVRQRVLGVGRVLERSAMAQVILEQLDSIWLQVQRQVSAQQAGSLARPLRVMFILAHSPFQMLVAGAMTAAQSMLSYAGATNAVQGFEGYKPLTPEGMIAAQPDCLLLTEQGLQAAGGLETLFKLPGLTQTPAGRLQAVIAMDALCLLGFGPRMPETVLALHQALQRL